MKKFTKSCIPPLLLSTINRIRQKIHKYLYFIAPSYSAKITYKYSDFNVTYDNLWDSPNWVSYEGSKLKKFNSKPNIHQKSVITSCSI